MAALADAVKTDATLQVAVARVRQRLDLDLMTEHVEVLDEYVGGQFGMRRWILYDAERGFGFLTDTPHSPDSPTLLFTSSLYLAYGLDPTPEIVAQHKAETPEVQAGLAARFAEPIGAPSVTALVSEDSAAIFKLLLGMLRGTLKWDRMSIGLTPTTAEKGMAYTFYVDPDGSWGEEHDLLKKLLP